MRIYNRLIIFLALALGAVTAILTFAGQTDLQVYYIADIITYFVITLLYVYFNPRARGGLSVVGAVFFTGLAAIIALRVVEVIR